MLKTILICCLLVPLLQNSTFGMAVLFTDATAGCCDSSHTYQCLRCHCRRRNGGLSFPCRLMHRGQCHLAEVFELEEHNFSSKKKSLQSSFYILIPECSYLCLCHYCLLLPSVVSQLQRFREKYANVAM